MVARIERRAAGHERPHRTLLVLSDGRHFFVDVVVPRRRVEHQQLQRHRHQSRNPEVRVEQPEERADRTDVFLKDCSTSFDALSAQMPLMNVLMPLRINTMPAKAIQPPPFLCLLTRAPFLEVTRIG